MSGKRAIPIAVVLALSAFPWNTLAQSTISGQVTDTSKAPVPGVNVEATSPALIEHSRRASTSADGHYTILDLRPGTYTITFAAAGFATVIRTVDVHADITTSVDAELQVGSLSETLEVSSRDSADVHNATHPVTWTRQELDAVPTSRNVQSVGSYAPGVHLNIPDVGGSQQIQQTYMAAHGNPHHHDTVLVDGFVTNTTQNDGQVQMYLDNEMIQEATYSTIANSVDTMAGGVFANIVPKDGGNAFHGSFFGAYAPASFVGRNLDATLVARGLTAQAKVTDVQDFDGSFGGPIQKGKLWFLVSARRQRTFVQSPLCKYADGSPCVERDHLNIAHTRLTYQLNSANKISGMFQRLFKKNEDEVVYNLTNGTPATVSASSQRIPWVAYLGQAKWTGTPTQRLLFDAGLSISKNNYNVQYQRGLTEVPFTPEWYSDVMLQDTGTNLRYNVSTQQNFFRFARYFMQASGAYVAGSHQFRFGLQDSRGPSYQDTIINGDLYAIEANGIPSSVTVFNTPIANRSYLNADLGLYAQDTWTTKRLTVTPGVRWEYLSNGIRPETADAGRFVPARSFAAVTCDTYKGISCFKTWAPRVSAVYDLFGDHRTALKASAGKYEAPLAQGNLNAFNPMLITSQSRTWKNTVCTGPTCFPTDDQIGTAPSGGFGTLTPRTMDPNHRREYNLQYTVGVQHQLSNALSLNATWIRREDYQQSMNVNQAVPSSAWTPVTITNPLDGTPITLFNLDRSFVGVTPQLYLTNAPRSLRKNSYNGFEASLQGRLPHSSFFFFGWTRDRERSRHCEETIGGNSLSDPNSLRFCDWYGDLYQDLGASGNIPFRDEFKAQLNVRLPYGFEGSVALYSNPAYNTNFALPNQPTVFTAQVNSEPLFAGAQQGFKEVYWTVTPTTRYPANCNCPTPGAVVDSGLAQGAETIMLVAPGSRLTSQLTQLDFAVRRGFRMRGYTFKIEGQVFNVLNSNVVTAEAQALGSSVNPFVSGGLGGVPSAVLNPRMLRIVGQLQF